MRISIASITLALALITGCAGPTTGVAATGEKLDLVTHTNTYGNSYREKVGEVGTVDVYQTHYYTTHFTHWYPVQGKTQISDEDFFRIAGDQSSYGRTVDLRADARRSIKIGWAMTLVGIGAMVGGLAIPEHYSGGLVFVSGLSVGLGGVVKVWEGHDNLGDDHHAVELDDARRAAREYNHRLGLDVSMRF